MRLLMNFLSQRWAFSLCKLRQLYALAAVCRLINGTNNSHICQPFQPGWLWLLVFADTVGEVSDFRSELITLGKVFVCSLTVNRYSVLDTRSVFICRICCQCSFRADQCVTAHIGSAEAASETRQAFTGETHD